MCMLGPVMTPDVTDDDGDERERTQDGDCCLLQCVTAKRYNRELGDGRLDVSTLWLTVK